MSQESGQARRQPGRSILSESTILNQILSGPWDPEYIHDPESDPEWTLGSWMNPGWILGPGWVLGGSWVEPGLILDGSWVDP